MSAQRTIEISQEPTELFKLLKFENICVSGGEAKYFIAEGNVTVNGIIETRKRKKIRDGDVVGVSDEEFRVVLKQN